MAPELYRIGTRAATAHASAALKKLEATTVGQQEIIKHVVVDSAAANRLLDFDKDRVISFKDFEAMNLDLAQKGKPTLTYLEFASLHRECVSSFPHKMKRVDGLTPSPSPPSKK